MRNSFIALYCNICGYVMNLQDRIVWHFNFTKCLNFDSVFKNSKLKKCSTIESSGRRIKLWRLHLSRPRASFYSCVFALETFVKRPFFCSNKDFFFIYLFQSRSKDHIPLKRHTFWSKKTMFMSQFPQKITFENRSKDQIPIRNTYFNTFPYSFESSLFLCHIFFPHI